MVIKSCVFILYQKNAEISIKLVKILNTQANCFMYKILYIYSHLHFLYVLILIFFCVIFISVNTLLYFILNYIEKEEIQDGAIK